MLSSNDRLKILHFSFSFRLVSFASTAVFTIMTTSKLRILCLHGYTQNATMFRKKTAVARKSVEDLADFGKA